MSKNMLFWMSVIFFGLVLVYDVLAIGVTPGRKTIDFEPGLETNVDVTIFNNDNKNMNALIYIEGELNESVTVYEPIINFKSTDSSKKFTYYVKLPQVLREPGVHEARIVVVDVPLVKAGEAYRVGATAGVISQLYVNVPYPGKYAKVELRTSQNNKDKQILFLAFVNNLGTQDIVNAGGVIDIFSTTNQKIATVNTEQKQIPSKTREELAASWDTSTVSPGAYLAKLSLLYDEEVASSQTTFSVGDLIIDILDITVSDFRLGGIAKFNILVENKWGEQIKGVYSEMIIADQRGDEVTRFKSATKDVSGLEKAQLISFWDTAGVREGTYSGRVIVYYQDRTTERQLKAVVTLNEIKTQFVGVSAQAVLVKGGGTQQGLLMFAIVVLVIVNIFWFVYFKRKNARANQASGV